MMTQHSTGERHGKWELINNEGKGGNGEVWKVRDPDGKLAALKFMTKAKESAFERFKAEVYIHENHSDIDGVLPAIDQSIPAAFDDANHPWFVMPLASPLRRSMPYDFGSIIAGIIQVAETLTVLHSRGIVHRDLKPDNLLFHNKRPQVGDFGIADYPEKSQITKHNQQLGAYWTIAPEMLRSPDTADGRLADVYSLAKTMWMLLAKETRCFEGQYLPGRRPMALSAFFAKVPLLHMIENLLAQATAHEPDERPDMATFLQTLRDWKDQSGNYRDVSLGDWGALQSFLFPVNVPQRTMWTRPEDIVSIINILGKHAELNHMFAPDGGGLDLKGAQFSAEPDCIELAFSPKIAVILKPRVLIFESFPGFPEWSYFRLETNRLAPSGTYDSTPATYEELLEIAPGEYLPRDLYDQGFLGFDDQGEEIPFPKGTRVVSRQYIGSYVVFAKASHFNEIVKYRGDHNRNDDIGFRDQITAIVEKYGMKLRELTNQKKPPKSSFEPES